MDAPKKLDLEELYSFLDSRKGKLEGVAFTGGEPTMQQDLMDVMIHIRENFGMKIKLDTNGTNPEMLGKILSEGLIEYAAMDIKSAPESYSKAAGINLNPEMMKRITESKDMLIGGDIDYEFRTTVVGGLHNAEDFKGIAEYISGAKNYFIQKYTENENVLDKNMGFYEPDKEELISYLEIVRPKVVNASLRGID